MTGRGRGRATAPAMKVPNLALAGKREDKKEATSGGRGGKSPRGARGGRGGRGRGGGGRGGGSGREKLALIESQGIFSAGLSGGDNKKSGGGTDKDDVPVFTVSRGGKRTSRDGENGEETAADSGPGFAGWDELWQSDEEGEAAELADLLKEGFIADLKRGSRMPQVLPRQDEPQFVQLMHKRVKDELFSDEEEETKQEQQDEDDKLAAMNLAANVADESPTAAHSRRAAKLIERIVNSESSELLFIQLPSVLATLAAQATDDGEEVMDVQETTPASASAAAPPAESVSAAAPKKVEVPRGRCVGKLRVTRRGRVLLEVGGHKMDVTQATTGGQQESAVVVETGAEVDASAMGGGMFGGAPRLDAGTNAVYHLGQLRHHLTASLEWSGVCSERQPTRVDVSPERKPEKERADEQKKLRNELEKLEKDVSWTRDFAPQV